MTQPQPQPQPRAHAARSPHMARAPRPPALPCGGARPHDTVWRHRHRYRHGGGACILFKPAACPYILTCDVARLVQGMHWALAVVNMRAKRFEYYDSLGGRMERYLGVRCLACVTAAPS